MLMENDQVSSEILIRIRALFVPSTMQHVGEGGSPHGEQCSEAFARSLTPLLGHRAVGFR
jgi:hypothetical protein